MSVQAGDSSAEAERISALERENARLQRELAAALEQQTATSAVLKVISQSAFELETVLEALLENAVRLCDAEQGWIFRFDGEVYRWAAGFGTAPKFREYTEQNPLRPGRGSVAGRAVYERRPIHVPDVLTDPEYAQTEHQRIGGYRTLLGIPLLRGSTLLGIFALARLRVEPFSERQIGLVTTFADQAVIAIENVRLFAELQERNRALGEALEQQTATSEVLRVMSGSPADLQAVLDAVVSRAARLGGADSATLRLIDGDAFELMATYGWPQAPGDRVAIDRGAVTGRSVIERRTVHVHDLAAESEAEYPVGRGRQRRFGQRTVLATPLLREGEPIGAITIRRHEVRPFTERQIKLFETFADQAVIAIENARLFQELRSRVGELQALAEVGRAVSSSLDLGRVLRTIVVRAVQLSGATSGVIFEFDQASQTFRYRAASEFEAQLDEALRTVPQPLGEGAVGQAGATKAPVEIPDILAEGAYRGRLRDALSRAGLRALLAVPLLLEDRLLGGLVVARTSPGAFPSGTIALLQTFASQSALAIRNAQLFREIEEKSHELEVASRHKSEFLANMSHELRTPLNAIISFSEILQEDASEAGDEQYLDDLEEIHAAGKHLLGLINDILDLSKIEAGRMDLYLEEFDVAEMVRAVEALARPLVEKNGNELGIDCSDEVGTMRSDLTKVRQTLLNLLSNAAKFTERGTVSLTVRRETGADGAHMVSFAVRDSGIGMSEARLGRLFGAFVQADASTTRKYGGTGLGLAISRSFCQMLGGDISVASAPGEGSVFTVSLPAQAPQPTPQQVADSSADQPEAQDEAAVRGAPAADAPRVLVIDDEPTARAVVQRLLAGEGLAVTLASGGEQGVRLARTLRPDLIILDVLMPGLDGWEVLKQIKADPQLAVTPVIVATILDDRNLAFALGAADFLTKPLDRERLLAAVRRRIAGPARRQPATD